MLQWITKLILSLIFGGLISKLINKLIP